MATTPKKSAAATVVSARAPLEAAAAIKAVMPTAAQVVAPAEEIQQRA